MLKNKFFFLPVILSVIGIVFYSLSGGESYADAIEKKRKIFLKNLIEQENSPLTSLQNFSGLKYFEANKDFIVSADFKAEKLSEKSFFWMTDSTKVEVKKAGTAIFSVGGKTFIVSIFDEGTHYLFPFRDLTSGKQTYGGGRFITIPKDSRAFNSIEIDFNDAHNFYCAYNKNYICPIPPSENFISVEIKAGEKI